MLSNKKVLITNDDGVFAEGIKHLVKEIYKYTKNIVVIAPKNDSSAISHSITLRDGMKLERIESIYKDVETYFIVLKIRKFINHIYSSHTLYII